MRERAAINPGELRCAARTPKLSAIKPRNPTTTITTAIVEIKVGAAVEETEEPAALILAAVKEDQAITKMIQPSRAEVEEVLISGSSMTLTTHLHTVEAEAEATMARVAAEDAPTITPLATPKVEKEPKVDTREEVTEVAQSAKATSVALSRLALPMLPLRAASHNGSIKRKKVLKKEKELNTTTAAIRSSSTKNKPSKSSKSNSSEE